jgi:hydrogenase maturation protease
VLAGLRGAVGDSELLSCDGEVGALLELFQRAPELILVDAVDGPAAGLRAGELLRLEADDVALEQAALRTSTHAMGVAEAIALARALELLPERLRIIAIAGQSFTPGEGLGESVRRAADELIDELRECLTRT